MDDQRLTCGLYRLLPDQRILRFVGDRLDAVVDRLALSYAAIVATRAAIALIVMSGPASSGSSEILCRFDEGRLKNSILGMLRDWVASEVGRGRGRQARRYRGFHPWLSGKENTLCNVANLCEGSRIPGIQIARTPRSIVEAETSLATTLERG